MNSTICMRFSHNLLACDYQFRLRVLRDELQETSVDRTVRGALNPLVEELSDELERRPRGKVRVGHPLPVHGRVERDWQDGDDEGVVGKARAGSGERLRELVHSGFGQTVADHSWRRGERWFRSGQRQNAAFFEELRRHRSGNRRRPNALLDHQIRVLCQVLGGVATGPAASDANHSVELVFVQGRFDGVEDLSLLVHEVCVAVDQNVRVGQVVFGQVNAADPLQRLQREEKKMRNRNR